MARKGHVLSFIAAMNDRGGGGVRVPLRGVRFEPQQPDPRASLLFSFSMQFAKRKLRVFTHLIPRPLLLPWEVKGSCDFTGNPLQASHNPVPGFLCVFASLREPSAPLARPQRAMLRGHATERSCPPSLERDNLLVKNHISAYQFMIRL